MSQKKREPKATRKPAGEADGAGQAVNGVLVQFEPGASEGDRDLTVTGLGDIKQTEVPVLLGLARRATEQKLGIGGG